MPEHHRFLKFILPEKWFEAVKSSTKEWLIECPSCSHKRDVWDIGGVKYKAKGEPRTRCTCPECGETVWHKIRKKSEEERASLG